MTKRFKIRISPLFGELYTSEAFGCGLKLLRRGLGTPSAALADHGQQTLR